MISPDISQILVSIVTCIVFAAMGCAMLKLSEMEAGSYLATAITILTAAGFVINAAGDGSMSVVHLITFVVYLGILAFLHLTRNGQVLRWAGDIFIGSHAVYLLTNFMFVPIASLGVTIDKILYITNYKDIDLARPFDGLFHIHEAIWGSFIAVIAILPMIYLAVTRRKS